MSEQARTTMMALTDEESQLVWQHRRQELVEEVSRMFSDRKAKPDQIEKIADLCQMLNRSPIDMRNMLFVLDGAAAFGEK